MRSEKRRIERRLAPAQGGRAPRGSGPELSAHDLVEAARERLIEEYGAPKYSWQLLRSTASTYLTCSNIFGSATLFMAAKQLGHSVEIAERHYAGTIRGIHRDIRTLEEAMQIARAVEVVIQAWTNAARRRETWSTPAPKQRNARPPRNLTAGR